MCCLLFVCLLHAYSVFCFYRENVVSSCSSFLIIWCLYSQFANNHVVRIIILSVVRSGLLLCTATCSKFWLFVFGVCFFCLYVITYKLFVCCLLLLLLPYVCLVLCSDERLLFVNVFLWSDMMFAFSVCKQQPLRSYHYLFCGFVWIVSLHSYLFVVYDCSHVVFCLLLLCLLVCYYRSVICLLFVVCSFAVFLFCVVFVFEKRLFVVVFPSC